MIGKGDVVATAKTAAAWGRLTYEEYLSTPEIEGRFDIVDGQIIPAPSALVGHQIINRRFFVILDAFISERRLGELLYAPLDVVIRRAPLRTRQPDLLLLSNESFARMDLAAPIEETPELVIEIVSPSNPRRNVEDKLGDYASIGAPECWMASGEDQTIEVLNLIGGAWVRTALLGVGDRLASRALEGLDVDVGGFFGGR